MPLRAGIDEISAGHVVLAVGHKRTHRDLVAAAQTKGLSTATIVAGSLVNKDVPSGATVAGVPAKVRAPRC